MNEQKVRSLFQEAVQNQPAEVMDVDGFQDRIWSVTFTETPNIHLWVSQTLKQRGWTITGLNVSPDGERVNVHIRPTEKL